MGTGGWRRAFCTSVRGDPEVVEAGEQQRTPGLRLSPSPGSCAKLSFFSGDRGGSNPSTPRAAEAAGLRCPTKSKSPGSPPKAQCDTPPAVTPTSSSTTTLFQQRKAFSNPSSPRSPSSRFAIFKHHSRQNSCRICWHSLKPSQEAPVFTAECSHGFHSHCIAGHVRSHGSLACPVCSAAWRQAPLLSALHHHQEEEGEAAAEAVVEQGIAGETENRNPNRRTTSGGGRWNASKGGERQNRVAAAKVYDDDEPLLLVSKTNQGGGGVRFNPIPEAANEDKDDEEEYGDEDLEREGDKLHGLLATPPSRSPRPPTPRSKAGGVQVSVMPQAALLSQGRRHRNYVVAAKVKAPPVWPAALLDPARGRAPIDLVTVLDVSQGMTGEKLQMLKRAMRLVISSLGPADRLSMVAFSAAAGAKRLLHLRRMSRQGQRAARHIVERLVVVGGPAPAGGTIVGDALRKAAKVLEDRRGRNPVATIMLLSDTAQQQRDQGKKKDDDNNNHHHRHQSLPLSTMTTATATTRFAHLEIPVHAPGFGDGAAEPSPQKQGWVPSEDAFINCVGGLVSVVMQDVFLQLAFPSGDISAVYPCGGGGGGGGEVDLSGGCTVLRLGDLSAEEEREMLVELRVPTSSAAAAAAGPQHSHHHLSVKCNYRDPATQELAFGAEQILPLPPLLQGHPELGRGAPSSACSATSLRLRNLFVSTRAVAESRRLADLSDYAMAHHLLSSARSLLLQSASDAQDHQLVKNLDTELADLQRRRQCLAQQHQQEECLSPSGGRRRRREAPAAVRGEPLTPTSAWRAAEQLAKVAIMRKSLNRVSDLHGFENARF